MMFIFACFLISTDEEFVMTPTSSTKRYLSRLKNERCLMAMLFFLMFALTGVGQEEGGPDEVLGGLTRTDLDTLWIFLAACLVMFMQAGFALLEAGFIRAKNSVNVIMKNLLDFSFGSVAFWVVGFGIAYGSGNWFMGTEGWFLNADSLSHLTEGSTLTLEVQYFFQMVFAATAATIVSGAVAGRTKFKAYIAYSIVITAIIYPIVVHWTWGGGWISFLEPGYIDFAGSTIVHSTGGWLALCGAVVLGPRLGKYNGNGDSEPIPGHNIPLAALGTFILWFGWFGFNPGSTLGFTANVGHVAATTNMAAACGAISAMVTTWIAWDRPDLSMALNGAIGGLVSITSGCNAMSIAGAAATGVIGGIVVVASVYFIDSILKIDDPVGAISAHGTCGAWGTLASGLFATETGLFYGGGLAQLGTQAIMVLGVFAFCLAVGFPMFYLIKATIGFRVNPEEEKRGLDIDEHGMEAYPGFQSFLTE